MNHSIKHIIFDFDGSLLDTAPLILATMRATFEKMGLPARTEAECRSTIGLRLVDIPARLFPEHPGIGDEYAATYRSIFNELQASYAPTMFPHVAETLAELSKKGISMAVASSRSHRSLVELLELAELSQYFSSIIGGDDVKLGKPNPDPVLAVFKQAGWTSEGTLVVGDADVDILMGKAAGCTTCGVTYGNGTLTELQNAGADHIINCFSELMTLIG